MLIEKVVNTPSRGVRTTRWEIRNLSRVGMKTIRWKTRISQGSSVGGNEDHQIRNKDLSREGGNEDRQIRNKDPFRVRIRTPPYRALNIPRGRK